MPFKPPINSMADFVVFAFVMIVAIILILVAVGSVLWVYLSPEADISSILKALADIVSAIISALIGFLAGRGQGREDARKEEK